MKMPTSPMNGDFPERNYEDKDYNKKAPIRKSQSKDNKMIDSDLGLSKLTDSGNEKYNLMEAFSELRKEHNKFSQLLEQKYNYLSPIFHYLSSGNFKAALNGLEKLNDPMIVVDLINMIMNTKKIDNISIEFATSLLRKAIILAESSYMVHIKTGMKFISTLIAKFKMEIIQIKSLAVNNKVDLAREERVKKYEEFWVELKKIQSSSRLRKIKERYKSEEIGEIVQNSLTDINYLLEKAGY